MSSEGQRAELGAFSMSLAVADLDRSIAFYEALGFEVVGGGHDSADFPDTDAARWRMLAHGDVRLGLFEGMFEKNVLTFHPPDVRAVQQRLDERGVPVALRAADGSGPTHVMLEDPDGHPILLDQHH